MKINMFSLHHKSNKKCFLDKRNSQYLFKSWYVYGKLQEVNVYFVAK